MSYSLHSLNGDYIGHYQGTTIGPIKGDTRSLDNGSCKNGAVDYRNVWMRPGLSKLTPEVPIKGGVIQGII